jgi:predicted GIY-YIG superfamily endonuclease
MRPFFVYLLRCADGSYYAGHTDDLESHFAKHQSGEIGGDTATRRPVCLAWSSEMPTRADAIERERQIKGWSRAKKEALIRDDWDRIHELARCGMRPSTSVARETARPSLRTNGEGRRKQPGIDPVE